MSENVKEPLNPEHFLKIPNAFKEAVLRSEEALRQAEIGMRKTRESYGRELEVAKEAMIAKLDAGETTGDPLHDQLLRLYGFKRESIDPVLILNKKLRNNQDKLLAMLLAETRETGMVQSEQYRTHYTLYIGLIEGELMFEPTEYSPISYVLPIQRFFKTDPTGIHANGEFVRKRLITGVGKNGEKDVIHLNLHGNPFVNGEIRRGMSQAWFYVGDEIEPSLRQRNVFQSLFDEEKLSRYIESVRTAPDEKGGVVPIGGS